MLTANATPVLDNRRYVDNCSTVCSRQTVYFEAICQYHTSLALRTLVLHLLVQLTSVDAFRTNANRNSIHHVLVTLHKSLAVLLDSHHLNCIPGAVALRGGWSKVELSDRRYV